MKRNYLLRAVAHAHGVFLYSRQGPTAIHTLPVRVLEPGAPVHRPKTGRAFDLTALPADFRLPARRIRS